MKMIKYISAVILMLGVTCPAWADNLLVNGGFEASTSGTITPPGWVNVGHTEGVIAYAAFGVPVYEGNYFYDLGGFGDAHGPIGDGIEQSFATTPGTSYTVTFGLSSENVPDTNDETLTVSAANTSVDYDLAVTADGAGKRPFVTESIDFVATDATTTLSFIHTAGVGGNNDPFIDGVSVNATDVPEPGTCALVLLGLGVIGGLARRRR